MSVWQGKKLKISIDGTSHGEKLSLCCFGFPKMQIDEEKLSAFLSRRKPKNALSTSRKEADVPVFFGLNDGKINGAFSVEIENADVKKQDYEYLYGKPRPSHADYVSFAKDGNLDFSGGGRFSGRLTAPFCVAGGVLLQYLEANGIKICAYVQSVGKVNAKSYKDGYDTYENTVLLRDGGYPSLDNKQEIENEILNAKSQGDSVGGVIECLAYNVPTGLGDSLFDGLEGKISNLLYSIPAVKSVEFGFGKDFSCLNGSAANDEMYFSGDTVRTFTNKSGGINGGISNGEVISLRVAFKPTPSISKKQRTVDLVNKTDTVIEIKGRHDPCIVSRALPCVESAVAIALADELLFSGNKTDELSDIRSEIDSTDYEILRLIKKRLTLCKSVAETKRKAGVSVSDTNRENEIITRLTAGESDEVKDTVNGVYKEFFKSSKNMQRKLLSKGKYALIGEKLSHSYSAIIHKARGLEYELCEVKKDELKKFLETSDHAGYNVTIPYKKEIMQYLDFISPEAQKIGAVNTIIRKDDKLFGYNTDYMGLEYSFMKKGVKVEGKNVLVLGSGGASNTAVAYCKNNGAKSVTVVSRTGNVNYENCYELQDTEIIINATPVGMYPNVEEKPIGVDRFVNLQFVFDCIYNPEKTELIKSAEQRNILAESGIYMLVEQALAAEDIWLETKHEDIEVNEIANKLKQGTKL